MAKNNKYKKDHQADFLRYLKKRMPDKERNAFERNLQKDPFAEEALMGYDDIEPGMAEGDLGKLENRLKRRASGRQRVIWYRIAASVAVLMILSSIFIVIERNKPQESLSYSPAPEASKEIPEPSVQGKPVEKIINEKNVVKPPAQDEKEKARARKSESTPAGINEATPETGTKKPADAIRIAEAVKPDNLKGEVITAKAALAKRPASVEGIIRGKIISAEDNQPIPGATISIKGTDKGTVTDSGGNFNLDFAKADNRLLVANYVGMKSKEFRAAPDSSLEVKLEPSGQALSEVVVVGYGVAAAEGHIPARPVTGNAEFEKYVEANIQRPDTASSGQRVVVVLNFKVNADGSIDSIKVLRSPAKPFSDEAIRLLKAGPEWKPAEQNGKVISDQVRVRIVFK